METLINAALAALFVAAVLFMTRRSMRRAAERSAAIIAEIDRQSRIRGLLLAKAVVSPSWFSPKWAKAARCSVKNDAIRMLARAKRSLTLARSLAAGSPASARALLGETAANLLAAEKAIVLADEVIPAIVEEQRKFARDMLEKVRVFRGGLEKAIRRHIAEGLPCEDSRMRISLMRNALEADANAIDHDPQGSLDLMRRQLEYMEGVGGAVVHLASLRDHILELGRTLPSRVDDAETAFAAAHRMLADLKSKRPSEDWSGAEEVLRTLPGLFESVRGRIRAAEIISRSDPGRLSEALAEASAAENAMAVIDGRLVAVMETWSECLSVSSKSN